MPVTPEMLAPFLLAVVAILIAPGPDMAFVVACGISAGRRGGVLAALGITAGVSVHVLLAILGAGALLRTVPELAEAIRLLGALYLVYLAVTTWQDAGSALVGGSLEGGKELASIFWRGMVVNLTNPKTILFFTAFLTQFVEPERGFVQAPTPGSTQSWHFIVVTDPSQREALAALYRKGARATGQEPHRYLASPRR